MRIDINNQQYRQFVEFATTAGEGDFAKLGNAKSVVKKTEWDYYGNIGRRADSRKTNNEVRTLFMSTILGMFGVASEEQLPETLRAAMKLHDYGEGRPLSARRIRAVDREIRALSAVNFTGKMAKPIADIVLKGCGIPKSADPAQEIKQRTNAIAKAMVQTCTAKAIGSFLRTDSKGNKIDHFDFEKKNTAFEKDLSRFVNFRINGGPVLSKTGYQATRDEIVKFITDGQVQTFAEADEKTKLTAHVLMANANQSISGAVMGGVGNAFDPQGNVSRLNGMGQRQTFNVNLTKDDNGNFVIKSDVKFTSPLFDYTDEAGRKHTYKADTGAYCNYHIDVTIPQASLDAFADADWENFDYGPIDAIERDKNISHNDERAAEKLPDACRLDIDVDVSYQMHADEFFEMDKPVVEPGKRSDHNAEISRNLFSFEFGKLPEDILEAIDSIKDAINARCGAGTVASREGVLKFIGSGKLKEVLDEKSIGYQFALDGNDVREAINDIISKNAVMEHMKLLERMKTIAAEKGIGDADISRVAAYNTMRSISGLEEEMKGCKTQEEFAAVLDKYGAEIEKRVRLSAKLQRCKAEAPEMLVQEYVKATNLPADKLRPLISTYRFKVDEVADLITQIERGEVKVESEEDVEQAFAEIVKKYVADRHRLAEEADKLTDLPEWARKHLRLAAFTAQNVSEFRLAEYAPIAGKLDFGPLKSAVCGEPFDKKNVVRQLLGLCTSVMATVKAQIGPAFDKLGADPVNVLMSIVFKCALAKDTELLAALTAKADEISAEVFALKKPSDVGEGVKKTDFVNLKQLSDQILQAARDLSEQMQNPV